MINVKENVGGREKIVHLNVRASATIGKTFDQLEDSVMDRHGAVLIAQENQCV